MPTKDAKTVQVLFPCVHGLAKGQLITINCFPVKELKSAVKVVTGVDEEIAGRIIGAARYNENDSRTGLGVMVLFSNPMFSGESYGLALAVADKLARFEPVKRWSEIYATGQLTADGCGRVDTVGCFSEKLDLLLTYAKPGSVFIYPAKNHIFSEQISEKLEQLKARAVKCIPIALLADLNDKLWQVSQKELAEKSPKWGILRRQWGTSSNRHLLIVTMLIATACLLVFFMFQPQLMNTISKKPANNSKPATPIKSITPENIRDRETKTADTSIGDSSVQALQKGKQQPVHAQKPVLESGTTDSTPY